ncbi:hypothetical protein [Clostridium sp. C2-6-12]|uniref:hypothetical protein n=1 Tax=Clostridium sp. C2-6-12 TaxID=2698832 RepID=UPI00136EA4CD|nr:hypothetical protein [Clostridium sp. C2-6-12]
MVEIENIFEDNGSKLFELIRNINKYNINDKFPSMKKTIKNFDADDIYDEILNFIIEKDDDIIALSEHLREIENDNINVSLRIKSEQSFNQKWKKNLEKSKQLREVCNDIIGIRIIADMDREDIAQNAGKIINSNNNYKIDIVNMYEKSKSIDDGYRGIHIYFRDNPKCFPIEIQIWNQQDALLNFYTHDIIYKKSNDVSLSYYSYELRNWLDNMPEIPDNVEVNFIKYLYKFVYSEQGGE